MTATTTRTRKTAAEVHAIRVEAAKGAMRYAEEHYNEGGWDVIVECYSIDDIVEAMGRAYTVSGALKALAPVAGHATDIRGTAF